MSLPEFKYQQYFNHLVYGNELISFDKFVPYDGDYTQPDRSRFEFAFLTDQKYFKDKNVLDLGCYTGFLSYLAKQQGAGLVHGINIRMQPHVIASHAFAELEQNNYQFDVGDAEDTNYLKEVCKEKDTVLLCKFLAEIKNPMSVLETISNSNIKHLVYHDTVFSEFGPPSLEFRLNSTKSDLAGVSVSSNMPDTTIVAHPNVPWLTTFLYYFGWKIEHFKMTQDFNPGWFGVKNQVDYPPRILNTAHILATRF